jgi:hypothetical protein
MCGASRSPHSRGAASAQPLSSPSRRRGWCWPGPLSIRPPSNTQLASAGLPSSCGGTQSTASSRPGRSSRPVSSLTSLAWNGCSPDSRPPPGDPLPGGRRTFPSGSWKIAPAPAMCLGKCGLLKIYAHCIDGQTVTRLRSRGASPGRSQMSANRTSLVTSTSFGAISAAPAGGLLRHGYSF